MPKTKSNNNIIFIAIAVLIILAGSFYFFYFSKKSDDESKNKTEIPATNADSSLPLKKLQNLGEFSQIKGEELLGLLNLLQAIKLDLSFFQSDEFRKPDDFYHIIEIKDEEKGNTNLFKAQ